MRTTCRLHRLLMAVLACVSASAEDGDSCRAFKTLNLSGVQDAPTQVVSAEPVDDHSAYCRVIGYVIPQVGFEIHLPAKNWNRKFLALGSGGQGGVLRPESCAAYVQRGYACG